MKYLIKPKLETLEKDPEPFSRKVEFYWQKYCCKCLFIVPKLFHVSGSNGLDYAMPAVIRNVPQFPQQSCARAKLENTVNFKNGTKTHSQNELRISSQCFTICFFPSFASFLHGLAKEPPNELPKTCYLVLVTLSHMHILKANIHSN